MVEMHPSPDDARSDAAQTIDTETFAALCREVRAMHTSLQEFQESVLCSASC